MKNHLIPPCTFVCASVVLLLAIAPFLVAAANSTFLPILLNCGVTGGDNDSDGRLWTGDTGSQYASSLNGSNFSAPQQAPSVPQVPYWTARVFTSPYTYSFPLGTGRIFIRLYFYPTSYSNHAASDAFFSVTAGPYTLLKNFSAYLTADALNFDYLIREFSVDVFTGGLNLTFTPTNAHANSYAFINGIEIVSIPNLFNSTNPRLVNGGTPTVFPIDQDQALQTVYRLNVGGQAINPPQDSGGLFRSWEADSSYIYGAAFGVTYSNDPNVSITYPADVPKYIAPPVVYSTARSMGPNAQVNLNYNLTWILPVDAGFYYLVRLHFCEIQYLITKINQRVFIIYLNNQTAELQADVITWTNGISIPTYRDYVVIASGSGQMDLWVALHPDTRSESEYSDAILNGLEVFKLQNSENSLAGLNPEPRPVADVDPNKVLTQKKEKHKGKLPAIIGGVIGGFVILLAAICLVGMCKRQKKKKEKKMKDAVTSDGPSAWLTLSLDGNSHSAASAKTATGSYGSSLPSNLCRCFSIAEIKAATKDFDESLLLGVGGFGKVYCGEIDGGTTKVAIKRGNPMSEQGVHEFQTEIEMLSKLRHRHLVSLIGYCEENYEMILVYDYMAHGTLREHLYKTQKPPLPWKQRLEICIGAARGLHYLHTGAKHIIIHRDVKSTNILLDEKWVAKVSDFGLSKTGPTVDESHVSTVVKGSFGYLDPEYFRRQQLTEKSDVYSFGVVLFEVLCARPALNPTLPKEQVSLAEWALHCQKKGMLHEIIDPYLQGRISTECFKKFAETAEKCVAVSGMERPSMGDVLWNLEFALQLQESAEKSDNIIGGLSDEATPFVMFGKRDPKDALIESSTTTTTTTTTTTSIGGRSLASVDSDGLTPSAVFSQIVNPKGR